MSKALVDKIADAVLYEGYMLYPYRPSIKNHHRWTFGGIFPKRFCQTSATNDSASLQTQCLLTAGPSATISIKLRFLHLMDRSVQKAPAFEPVERLRVGEREYQSWQEAVEREVVFDRIAVDELMHGSWRRAFSFPESRNIGLLEHEGRIVGRLVRTQHALNGDIEISAKRLSDEVVQINICAINCTEIDPGSSREKALMCSFASTHLILRASNGQFISLTDPPKELADFAAMCKNIGCWPVLAGEPNQTDTLLVSPIILPDYPQIAAQSPGDLFDGTEIDEILTLRVLTLTDAEKQQAAAVDDRVSQLLERTQSLAREQLMNLHGQFKPVSGQQKPDMPVPWDPLEERKRLEKTLSAGIELRPGDRVRLRPQARADIFDIALAGKTATIAAIEQDYENRVHLAVTIDDDPGRDLGAAGKIGHRFFFSPDEVEVIDEGRPA
ncbi:MAG TPA: hypothetical protein VG722_08420 [Tepidisphaeraceae bacterium]|nr:hypothetical protein [Tepidisphaeraceae bacterium]